MNNTSQSDSTSLPSTPPEAYAAFVRLYIEWMDQEEEDQIKSVKKFVRNSGRRYNLRENGPELFGAEFNEYVDEVVVSFLEQCTNVDEFAEYLQKSFSKSVADYQKMKTEFLEKSFQEWEDAEKRLTDEEFDDYITKDFIKKQAEFEKKKKAFDKYRGYPMSETMFRRYVQRVLYRLKKDATLPEVAHLSFDDENASIKIDKYMHTLFGYLDKDIELKKLVEHWRTTLDETDCKIVEFYENDETITAATIAQRLGISGAAVSKRKAKMWDALTNIITAD